MVTWSTMHTARYHCVIRACASSQRLFLLSYSRISNDAGLTLICLILIEARGTFGISKCCLFFPPMHAHACPCMPIYGYTIWLTHGPVNWSVSCSEIHSVEGVILLSSLLLLFCEGTLLKGCVFMVRNISVNQTFPSFGM